MSMATELASALATPAVEIDVSGRCDHECFYLMIGSPSVWHFHGAGSNVDGEDAMHEEADEETPFVFHEEDCDDCECFSHLWEDSDA